jgi:hypothetical protein
MWHKAIYAAILALLLSCTLLLLPSDEVRAQHDDTQVVRVENFPDVQQVAGEIRVTEPVPASRLASLPEVIAVPAAPDDPTQLTDAGSIDTAGWGHAVLTLTGEVRGRGGAGEVGALLVPDVEPVRRVFEQGRILFPLEVSAEVKASARWVESDQPRVELAFPRYRVYLYNTSDRSVAVSLYAYLTE